MTPLINDFNKLYPAFSARKLDGCDLTIREYENADRPGTIKYITIENIEGWEFSRDLLEKTKSFHDKAQSRSATFVKKECHDIMMKECDGLFCTENDGIVTFHVFELKSSFNLEDITKAKNQITGSYLKLLHLLYPLQSFIGKTVDMVGYIVVHEPTTERLSNIKDITDPRGRFCLHLHEHGNYDMPSARCSRYWHPLICPDMKFRLIEVPAGNNSYRISL